MQTLISRIERAAESDTTLTVASPEGYDTTSWAQTHAEARSLAAALQAEGVSPGDHVAILGPTTRPLITAIQATWLTGACLVMLPLPMRLGSIEAFVDQTRSRIRAADCSLVLIDEQFAPFVERAEGDPPFVVLQELVVQATSLTPTDWKRPDENPDALAVLQFTSGSTAEPKGVMLPHRTMCANLDACTEAGGLVDHEVFVSWLPLYHDMGLI
ncbi:MAG: AMP-binding protein, partial [Microthrixaceae bacterium]|nr:AMP-binding protein [Microthrixaceae bacterium]